MKKSILITKDNPLTPSKLEKRVSFIDEEEKVNIDSIKEKTRIRKDQAKTIWIKDERRAAKKPT